MASSHGATLKTSDDSSTMSESDSKNEEVSNSDPDSLYDKNSSSSETDDNTSNDSSKLKSSDSNIGGSENSTDSKTKLLTGKLKNKRSKWYQFVWLVLNSDDGCYGIIKKFTSFFVGIALSYAFYRLIIMGLNLGEDTRLLAGGVVGMGLTAGFTTSVSVRCVACLIFPTFFSSAGRSYVDTFAIAYLIAGPVDNLLANGRDVTRSLICSSELSSNQSMTRMNFQVQPISRVLKDMMDEGVALNRIGKSVNRAFTPVKDEIRKKKKKGRQRTDSDDEQKKEVDEFKTADELETEYKEKVKDRCEDVYNGGIKACKDVFVRVYNKCIDKVPMVGPAVCWVVQVGFICDLLRYIPDIVGSNCDSIKSVDKGFGENYKAEEDAMKNMEKGFDVNIQYKVIETKEDLDYATVEQMRKSTMHDFNQGKVVIDYFFSIIGRVLSFTFALVMYRAHQYHRLHTSDLRYDNLYVTSYFRQIDARRKAKGKKTLLPLKKVEHQAVIYPTSIKMSKPEKKKLTSRSMIHLTKVFMAGLICLTDYLFSNVLQTIATKSKIDFRQTGTNHMEVNVTGVGFMSQIVRSFMSGLNTHQELDQISTNAACLPHPKILENRFYHAVFGIYFVTWILLVLESYGYRLRRLISAYFCRKREKMRVLFLYNDLMRKRKNFLKIMRRRVKRKAKKSKLKQLTTVSNVLVRIWPALEPCMRRFNRNKSKCLVCEEKMKKNFHICPSDGCGFAYCEACWQDLQNVCYACLPISEISSTSSSDSEVSSGEGN